MVLNSFILKKKKVGHLCTAAPWFLSAIGQMPRQYFVTGTFQPLNSTTEQNTKFLCLSHPQLHKPPRSCRIERPVVAEKQDFASLIGSCCTLVYSIPGNSQSFMRMAVPRSLGKPKYRVPYSGGAGKLSL